MCYLQWFINKQKKDIECKRNQTSLKCLPNMIEINYCTVKECEEIE